MTRAALLTEVLLMAAVSVGCAQAVSDDPGLGADAGDDVASADAGDAPLPDGQDGGDEPIDATAPDTGGSDAGAKDSASDTGSDTGAKDSSVVDSGATDTGVKDTDVVDTGPSGPITGGPCISGAPGATAIRVRFYNGGGKATVAYDVWGLPNKSRQKVGVYGYTIPYSTPAWADPYLGEGGLPLDSSNFIDVELSTVGLSSISSVTLSIYGRSYATGSSGSFTWQTFKGTGGTPTNFVSNVAPYKWYGGNASAAFVPSDGGVLLRIKAGPSSNSLVINKIELCMEAS